MRTPGAGGPVGLTAVPAGAAVVSIFTADGLRQRAAAPFVVVFHEAAGRVFGTAGLGIAHVLGRLSWIRKGLAGLLPQGWYLPQPGQAEATGLITGLLGHIAFVAFGAAVLMIVAAHSLR